MGQHEAGKQRAADNPRMPKSKLKQTAQPTGRLYDTKKGLLSLLFSKKQ